MKTLYKKDSKGKIREWTICTIDDELIQKSGIVDGKLVEHNKLCKSKNVGKSNSTTGSEQAILEMESLIKSKLSEGYFKTKDEAENELVILPMLASDYNKFSKKIDWNNCWVQPKLDGMRCLAFCNDGDVRLMSRDGKTIENMDHIIESLKMIKGYCVLDGELYSHGRSFQENMKLIKKYVPNYTEGIQYHVYDLVCAEDGSKHTIATIGEAMDSADKATNKAMSAAYKYAAFQAFAIPTEGDNDADAHTHVVAVSNIEPDSMTDLFLAIHNAKTQDELKLAYKVAYAACDGDKAWQIKVIAAKDEAKGKL